MKVNLKQDGRQNVPDWSAAVLTGSQVLETLTGPADPNLRVLKSEHGGPEPGPDQCHLVLT